MRDFQLVTDGCPSENWLTGLVSNVVGCYSEANNR